MGDSEFWMLKGSSSFRQDLRTSWILWGALGSSCKRDRGEGGARCRQKAGEEPNEQLGAEHQT